ncbi:hypothetical protein RJ640_003186 [Escallonia rubra]|uniref:Carotenoid isomerase n=1 Tax=Escallonia rubra TaxID=112253 RepID=A0AA88RMN3_9ASTE|nr:hypothetical protein RJ640_003186 [Escallonia rubra]
MSVWTPEASIFTGYKTGNKNIWLCRTQFFNSNKKIQPGNFRPTYKKQRISCNRPLKTQEFTGHEVGVSQNKRGFLVSTKAVMDMEKVLESDGSVGGVDGNESSYDAIVVGSGIGGLVAATQLAVKGARVLVLEKYVIPGGSSGFYERDGYTFDVGSSVMFGFSDKIPVTLASGFLPTESSKFFKVTSFTVLRPQSKRTFFLYIRFNPLFKTLERKCPPCPAQPFIF